MLEVLKCFFQCFRSGFFLKIQLKSFCLMGSGRDKLPQAPPPPHLSICTTLASAVAYVFFEHELILNHLTGSENCILDIYYS